MLSVTKRTSYIDIHSHVIHKTLSKQISNAQIRAFRRRGSPEISNVCGELWRAVDRLSLGENGAVAREEQVKEKFEIARILVLRPVSMGKPSPGGCQTYALEDRKLS